MTQVEYGTELRTKMRTQEVTFTFIKKDGSTREAIGTLKAEVIEPQIKGTGRPMPEDMLVYFDLDKLAFRSCHFNQLVLP